LVRAYWQSRLRMVEAEIAQLKQTVQGLFEAQAGRSAPLQHTVLATLAERDITVHRDWLEVVGSVTGYRGDEASLERGRHLDARAWLLIRGWISPVVRVEVADETDPAPYWLVSTRQPDAVIDALVRAKAKA